jgi:hypothetical protein
MATRAVDAIADGDTLITFPTLTALGLPATAGISEYFHCLESITSKPKFITGSRNAPPFRHILPDNIYTLRPSRRPLIMSTGALWGHDKLGGVEASKRFTVTLAFDTLDVSSI